MAKLHPGLPVDGTFLPPLPPSSKLTIVRWHPDEVEISYPVEASFLKWALFFILFFILAFPLLIVCVVLGQGIPWIPAPVVIVIPFVIPFIIAKLLTRPLTDKTGGRIYWSQSKAEFRGGTWLTARRTFPRQSGMRIDTYSDPDSDSNHLSLVVIWENARETIARETDLSPKDLKWLKLRLNEWLGWEFPDCCVRCGKILTQRDVDWHERSIACQDCGYLGPSPDPFNASEPLPVLQYECPNCTGPLLLRHTNRETGGCRCAICGWESSAYPPLQPHDFASFGGYFEALSRRIAPLLLKFPQYLVPERSILGAFPTVGDAMTCLELEQDANRLHRHGLLLHYSHWQIQGMRTMVGGLSAAVGLLLVLFCTVLNVEAEARSWALFAVVLCSRFLIATLVVALGVLVWWANRRIELTIEETGLLLETPARKHLILWHTLDEVAIHARSWPPLLLFVQTGQGLTLAPPNLTTAMAIARICLAHINIRQVNTASPLLLDGPDS